MDFNIQGTIFKDVNGISKIDNFDYKLINYYRNSDIINAKINLNVDYYDNNYDKLIKYNDDVDFRVMLDDDIILSTFQLSNLRLEALENQGFNIIYDVSIEADRNGNNSSDNSVEDNIEGYDEVVEQDNNQEEKNTTTNNIEVENNISEKTTNNAEEQNIINDYEEKTKEKLTEYLKDRKKLTNIREEKASDLIGELKENYSTYKIVFLKEGISRFELADKYDVVEENIYIDSNNPNKAIIRVDE